jgi:hypothetical protein
MFFEKIENFELNFRIKYLKFSNFYQTLTGNNSQTSSPIVLVDTILERQDLVLLETAEFGCRIFDFDDLC